MGNPRDPRTARATKFCISCSLQISSRLAPWGAGVFECLSTGTPDPGKDTIGVQHNIVQRLCLLPDLQGVVSPAEPKSSGMVFQEW